MKSCFAAAIAIFSLVVLEGCSGKPAVNENAASQAPPEAAPASLPVDAYPVPESPTPKIADADRPSSIDEFRAEVGVHKILTAFGRGTGPSPVVPAFAAARLGAPAAARPAEAAPSASPAPAATSSQPVGANDLTPDEKIKSLQTSIEEFGQANEALKQELRKSEATVEELQKKLKRLAISSSKSKRGKEAKSEFQRELNQARSEVTKIKGEIKKNEERLAKAENELKKYQPGAG